LTTVIVEFVGHPVPVSSAGDDVLVEPTITPELMVRVHTTFAVGVYPSCATTAFQML